MACQVLGHTDSTISLILAHMTSTIHQLYLLDLIENLTACAEQKKPEQVEDRSSDIEARINEAKALYALHLLTH